MLGSERLAGKVAVVTGAANGIGEGCARMFAQAGAIVIGCDIDAGAAEAALARARADGITLDITA
ncbi:MAG: SDR family NAD(P)-dependent oxidoreductase, partial [Sphingomonas sp.]